MKITKPKAMLFDVFGSLVDWRTGVAAVSAKTFKEKSVTFDPFVFADLWRAEYFPAMQRIRQGNRNYVPLDILHRENLDIVLEKTGLGSHFNQSERDLLNKAWEQLPPWRDTLQGLNIIRHHCLVAPCSNGSIALMARLARHAGFHWDAVLGAEIAQNYKPQPEVYLASCKALGFEPGDVMMVAAHNSDLVAARKAGLMTGFFARPTEYGPNQKIDLEADEGWDFIGKNMLDFRPFLEQI